jgi:hypothetical protein
MAGNGVSTIELWIIHDGSPLPRRIDGFSFEGKDAPAGRLNGMTYICYTVIGKINAE